jgi:hypothetical protein
MPPGFMRIRYGLFKFLDLAHADFLSDPEGGSMLHGRVNKKRGKLQRFESVW